MTEQVTDQLLKAAQDCTDITKAMHDVLVADEDSEIELPDGTKTESLKKIVKDLGGQVTSVGGKTGDISAIEIKESLELGSAAGYAVEDLPVPSAERIQSGNGKRVQQNLDAVGTDWYAKVGGYAVADKVRLSGGGVVISTVAANTNNPNSNMTGWKYDNLEIDTVAQLPAGTSASQEVYVRSLNTYYKYDPATSSINNGGTIINGWTAKHLKYVTPEMFGADPTGLTSSRIAIKKMIDSLANGGVIECKPNAIYYNDAPSGSSDNWLISQDNIYIIANGATFKRRKTSTSTSSIDSNLAALQVNGDFVTIDGKIKFDGSEDYASIVNTSGTAIAVGEYVRGYKSSHGLYLYRAHNFTALDVESRNAVFNIFADRSNNIRIKGYCKSSGQVYPLAGSDLQLGSGIKAAYCENLEIDLITEYAGYAGTEIEPACKFGHVKSVARKPAFFGAIFHAGCEDLMINVVAEGAVNGGALRLGNGSKRIIGNYSANGCKFGLSLEPSATDATISGDITECDLRGVSSDCTDRAVYILPAAAGGKVRETSIYARSRHDGSDTTPAITLNRAENCSFDFGVTTAKRALVCDGVNNSEIHMAYMSDITELDPMYFTANNAVDLTFKLGNNSYYLTNTSGRIVGSSLTTATTAIPVVAYTALDIRAANIVMPNLKTTISAAVANSLWVDTANGNTIKRKD